MKMYEEVADYNKHSDTIVSLEGTKDVKALQAAMQAVVEGKPLSKRSAAYKLAKTLADELPAF